MSSEIQVKVCGLTSLADAEFASSKGADYLGFIFHPKSPRFISMETFGLIRSHLPGTPKVAVLVEPEPAALLALRDAGFDRFQIHFRHDLPLSAIESWTNALGAKNLWLAPKLPPGVDMNPAWMNMCDTFLVDTFDATLFGGTGRTGDWPKFKRLHEGRLDKTWILSGGLTPANITDALAGSGAKFVDVNSGVESVPGVKDHAKIEAFFKALD
ncbi:MAG TPA: phosphoribosylanthranilate isomerase [Opitutaceae bacterium]|jgi:phosphoribosylanthranilate isomerase|nr:phosphoribosylanthranilate isomerase [Opitutaceae bacterium]